MPSGESLLGTGHDEKIKRVIIINRVYYNPYISSGVHLLHDYKK